MGDQFRILGIAGSLRKGSYNRAALRAAFVTPEYDYSIPGVLKNATDWASRPYGDSAWNGKPVAVMGASVALQGTSRAQYHLRRVFVYTNVHPLNRPEVMIAEAARRFDEHGNLTDGKTKELIGQLLAAPVVWSRRLQSGTEAGGRAAPA